MQDSKFFLLSRSVWGLITVFGGMQASKNGWDWWGMVEPQLADVYNNLVTLAGGYFAAKGTFQRTTKLTLDPRRKPENDVKAEARRMFDAAMAELETKKEPTI